MKLPLHKGIYKNVKSVQDMHVIAQFHRIVKNYIRLKQIQTSK